MVAHRDSAGRFTKLDPRYATEDEIRAEIGSLDAALRAGCPLPRLPQSDPAFARQERQRRKWVEKLTAERKRWNDVWYERFGKQPKLRGPQEAD
jgi:hypothetical protein